jgi:L-ascorbate metabolism protein UlaG (beta-lactamase superfamily)
MSGPAASGVPVRVTWWGHATATIEIGGVRILTDPVLTPRIGHLHRLRGLPPPPAAAQADLVVVSHLHSDHLHGPSLRRLAADTEIVVPQGAAAVLGRWGRSGRLIREVRPADEFSWANLRIRVVSSAHDGRRNPGSSHRGPALGYLIEHAGVRLWFAGDTGLSDGIRRLGPVDVALLPIGGWGPSLGTGHLDPAQAAEAARRVGARHVVPIHHGTFWPIGLDRLAPRVTQRLFFQPGQRFAADLAAHAPASTAHQLAPGQTATLIVGAR